MSHDEKEGLKHRWTHREVVVFVASGGVLRGAELAVALHTTADEGWVAYRRGQQRERKKDTQSQESATQVGPNQMIKRGQTTS